MAIDIPKRNKRQYQWEKENKDRINLTFTKGLKERVQEASDQAGLSKTRWVEAAILEKLERQNATTSAALAGYDKQAILDEIAKVRGIGKQALERVADLLPD